MLGDLPAGIPGAARRRRPNRTAERPTRAVARRARPAALVPMDRALSTVPPHAFTAYDDMVVVETLGAELVYSGEQARAYSAALDRMSDDAVEDDATRRLIGRAVRALDE